MSKTRHNIIAEGNTLNFLFPRCWQELSQRQLKAVLVFLSAYKDNPTEALLRITLYFANMVIVKAGNGHARCRLVCDKGVIDCSLSAEDLTALSDALLWIRQPGVVPVLLEESHGGKAIDKSLRGVSFSDYIQLDNLFQGYLMSKNTDAVSSMADIIYPGRKKEPLKGFEIYGIILWYTQIKEMFVKEFPNFFRRSGSVTPLSVRDAMNAQIRALTGGDVTKEPEVLATDTWRALTELNAKAVEAEEFKKSMKK